MEYKISDIKKFNTLKVFQAFRENPSLSRREAEEITGLSWGNVYSICNKLLLNRFLVAEKETNWVGRPPEILMINPLRKLSLGIDINSVGLSFNLVNLRGQSVYSEFVPVLSRAKSDLLSVLMQKTGSVLARFDDVISINLSMQGKLNSKTGISIRSNFFQDWQNIPLVRLFEERFGLPTQLYHDPECLLTYHLHNDKRLKNLRNIVIVRIDEGIGFARLIDGKLYEPDDVNACELGHTIVVPHGKPCICGKQGCLEAYSSLRGMKILYLEKTGINAENLTEVFESKSEEAEEIRKQAVSSLGISLSNLFTISSPEAILLDGIACDVVPNFFDDVKQATESYYGGAKNLLKANHHRDAPAIGASLLTIEKNLEAILFDDDTVHTV